MCASWKWLAEFRNWNSYPVTWELDPVIWELEFRNWNSYRSYLGILSFFLKERFEQNGPCVTWKAGYDWKGVTQRNSIIEIELNPN